MVSIAKGDDASLAFFNIVMGVYAKEEKAIVMKDLEEYCALDTEGVKWIVDKLTELGD